MPPRYEFSNGLTDGRSAAVSRSVFLVAGALMLALAQPVAAQGSVTVGDAGPAAGDFGGTDEACGFGSYTDDSYVAELGEDNTGVYIAFTQGSTGDSGRFRSDADGSITFETAGDEEYVDIEIDGEALFALYRYTSGDCTQEWVATVTLPAGFIKALIAGNAASPETEEPVVEEPETEEPEPEPETEEPETEDPEAEELGTDDGDGFGVLDLGFWGFLSLLLIGVFWGLRLRSPGPKRLFRADRGDPGEILDDELVDDESGPPGIIRDDGETVTETPLPPVEPEEGDCEPERQELRMAQEAKDEAFAAGEQADVELAEAKDGWGRIDATTRNPLGDRPPVADIDPTASETEQARKGRVHELNIADWQRLEDEASEARSEVDAAKARLDKAQTDSTEAWQDFQRMRTRLEAARVALANCDGSAPPAADAGTGNGDPGDGAPGIITQPPPAEPDPPDEQPGCADNDERDGKVISSTDFSVLGGPITVNVGTTAWTQAGNTFTAETFAELETSVVEDRSAGIEQGRRKVRISVTIPITVLTVKCVQILVCNSDRWVDSGNVRRDVERTTGPDITVLPTGAAGGRAMAKDRKLASNMVDKAKLELETLEANAESANNWEC